MKTAIKFDGGFFCIFTLMKKVLITGGTGLVGKRLSFLLASIGYEVRVLSRSKSPESKYKTFLWNVNDQFIEDEAFQNLDYIIHLAGAGIADKRWSDNRKKEIIDSRVESTNLLYNTSKRLKTPLKAFISASATGYYGSVTTETIFTETDQPATDFLGKVCRLWEESIFQFKNDKTRTVALRTGIVLSNDGGALKKMKTPVITPLGNGKQYMPWIHIDDLCELYIKAIEDDGFEGAYNAVSSEHQTNYSFSKAIAKIFNKPFLPIGAPSFILKIVFGEMATIILNGSRVSNDKFMKTEFNFKFNNLDKALKNLK
tara:strand:+ start:1945 stop:2886 length:942 start_codon:yes stop_codon:yes gene_type:complete